GDVPGIPDGDVGVEAEIEPGESCFGASGSAADSRRRYLRYDIDHHFSLAARIAAVCGTRKGSCRAPVGESWIGPARRGVDTVSAGCGERLIGNLGLLYSGARCTAVRRGGHRGDAICGCDVGEGTIR